MISNESLLDGDIHMTKGPKQDSQRVHVGQKAPVIRAQSLTGEIVSNEDLKGHWVMLSFHR